MTREEEIRQQAISYTMAVFGELNDFSDVTDGFIGGAKFADETMIKKACDYLKSLTYQEFAGGLLERLLNDDEINDFIKAMEE